MSFEAKIQKLVHERLEPIHTGIKQMKETYQSREAFVKDLLVGVTEGTPCKDIITTVLEMGLENKTTDYFMLAKLDKSLKSCIEGCQSKSRNTGLCLRIHNLGANVAYNSMNEILRTGNPEAPKKLADIYFSGINGRYA